MKRFYFSQLLFLAAILSLHSSIVSAQTDTFLYTGSVQTYTVPACVTSITVDMQGARGGHGYSSVGGYGGRVQCTLAVTPGMVLQVRVGGQGDTATTSAGGAGGYNGGAAGEYGYGVYAGGGGGGASDIRLAPYALANRVVVAGGGGGSGSDCSPGTNPDRGGNGGGLTGQSGSDCHTLGSPHAGGGGTPTAGGTGGVYSGWTSGNPGTLGNGGNCDSTGGSGPLSGGGGGGGGYYGGGGGSWGGGGGGSSYTDPVLGTGVTHTQGYDSIGNGMVIITGCNPPGTITGTFAVCIGGGTISVHDPDSISCGTWSSSNTAVATIGSTGIITPVSVGTTTITYNIPTPCGGAPATKVISVNPLPAAITGTMSVCVGQTTTLTDATGFGGWFSTAPAVATVGLTTGVVTGISIGTATIDYTLLTGCMATATVSVDCIDGVPQTIAADKYKVDIFPNPTNSELTIKTEEGAYSTFTVTNSMGQILMQHKISKRETKISVKYLASAVYYITLRGDNGTTVKRFVKIE